jgi:predicted nucleotidyltransferase
MVLMSTGPVPGREDILVALRNAKPLLDSFGVAQVSLFGSFARDEAREDSDVDVLVEFAGPIGMFDFVRLQRELGERIGRKVELVTPAALKPQLRDRILAEAVLAA